MATRIVGERYRVIGPLGEGGMGQVPRCTPTLSAEFVGESCRERGIASELEVNGCAIRPGTDLQVLELREMDDQVAVSLGLVTDEPVAETFVIRHFWKVDTNAAAGCYLLLDDPHSDRRAVVRIRGAGKLCTVSGGVFQEAAAVLVAGLECNRPTWRFQPLPRTMLRWRDDIAQALAGGEITPTVIADEKDVVDRLFAGIRWDEMGRPSASETEPGKLGEAGGSPRASGADERTGRAGR